MESEGSLPCSQQPTTCPYPKPDQPSPRPTKPTFLRLILILSFHLLLIFHVITFLQVYPPNPCMQLLSHPQIRAIWPTHFILLDAIVRTTFSIEYESWNSTLCNVLQSAITSSILRQNISLRTLLSKTLGLYSFLSATDHVSNPHTIRRMNQQIITDGQKNRKGL
jgi:hypothetical protein